jgi:hypothetical protein
VRIGKQRNIRKYMKFAHILAGFHQIRVVRHRFDAAMCPFDTHFVTFRWIEFTTLLGVYCLFNFSVFVSNLDEIHSHFEAFLGKSAWMAVKICSAKFFETRARYR